MIRRKLKGKGFTLAEVLIVVAIILALGSLAAVGVTRYQRSLYQLEMDGHAKEIFVAAQNHLSLSRSQNYPGIAGEDAFGKPLTDTESLYGQAYPDIYYFTVSKVRGGYTFGSGTLLDEMLPFASVDETLRLGGSYVVFYQKSTGTVLDVFYDNASGVRFGHDFSDSEGGGLMTDYRGSEKKSARAAYSGSRNTIIGWYGSALPVKLPDVADLEAPGLLLINRDTLRAIVLPPTALSGAYEPDASTYRFDLRLKGTDSGGEKVLQLTGTDPRVSWMKYDDAVPPELQEAKYLGTWCYEIVLDDITRSGLRFAAGFPELIPGEDVDITATLSQVNAAAAAAAKSSGTGRTNSLFAYDPDDDGAETANTAKIACFRHLENLDPTVSCFDPAYVADTGAANFVGADGRTRALQIADLTWDGSVYPRIYGDTQLTEEGYLPVAPGYALAYEGGGNRISGAMIKTAHGGAGIFGALENHTVSLNGADTNVSSSVSNLKLENITVAVSGSTDAGALAGTLTGSVVTNVVAYTSGDSAGASVTAGGSVGGLVGKAVDSTVDKSAAALIVESTAGAAGGLAGTAQGSGITSCYSGGHTTGGAYSASAFNVAAAGAAGGLVGAASGCTIADSYSTCSAKSTGGAAGGFLGTAENGSVTGSYATGLVNGSTASGAFAGVLSGTAVSDSRYYRIINERYDSDADAVVYLGPVNGAAYAGITPLDADREAFTTFTGVPASWRTASPGDTQLYTYYQGKYSLGGLAQLEGVSATDLAAVHYGDWPAPELWVVNP